MPSFSDDLLKKELTFLVLQYLDQENNLDLNQTIHRLEKESGVYFNMRYFEYQVMNGEWAEVEDYLSGFTKLEDNGFSNKMYFEIRKHKYLEALDRQDKTAAVEILVNELKVFQNVNHDLYDQITSLITLDNYRENKFLSRYGDTRDTRIMLMGDLTRLIQANPVFLDKLTFPNIPFGRLRTLINQSFNWQHQRCTTPKQTPEIKTLMTDHVCPPPNLNLGLVSQPASVSDHVCPPPNLNLGLVSQPASVSVLPFPSPAPPAPAPAPALAPARAFTYPSGRSPLTNYNIPRIPPPAINLNSGLNDLGTYGLIVSPKQITEPGQCLIFTLPDRINVNATKIGKLVYTNSGEGIWALLTSGKHKFWKWDRNATIENMIPQLSEPNIGVSTRNDALVVNLDTVIIPCLAIAKNEVYMLSACGGNISLVNMLTFKEIMTLKTAPPASTFVAFYPDNNHRMVFGMENSDIHMHRVGQENMEVQILKGHQKHVTGIIFSSILSLMVSAGADAQLLFWSMDTWEMKNSIFLQVPGCMDPLSSGDTSVQFHTDQIRILCAHETQLAIYLGSTMERVLQWVPQGEFGSSISSAIYSCDSSMIYVAFRDASVSIFDSSNLRMKCRISPNVYIDRPLMNGNVESEGVLIGDLAAHPYHAYQFAIGLSDGSVKVIQPKSGERQWGE